MKRIIIFEGIASSGKTTLERMLQEQLKNSTIISEGQTLMPLIENKESQKAVEHLSVIFDVLERQPAGTLIIDRFHITHAFRTGASLSSFSEIEQRLREKYNTFIVLLRMDERVILDRIRETVERRGSSWVKGKQGTQEEKVAYYKTQQYALTELVKQSILPVCTIDTTDKNWSQYIVDIKNFVT